MRRHLAPEPRTPIPAITALLWVVALWGCQPQQGSRSEPPPASPPAATAPDAPERASVAATAVREGSPREDAPSPVTLAAQLPGPDATFDVTRLRFAGTDRTQDWLLRQLQVATATAFEPVGSTSTVFRTTLVGPVDAAFKAPTLERPRGPASEVAAYRVARCLGLTHVPPAVSRQFRVSKLRAGLSPEFAGRWREIRERMGVAEDGVVQGTMIHWIEDLTDLGMDDPEGVERWTRWLRQGGELPADRRPLAASVSTVIAFDYLIGNFDRWSGGNARGNRTGTAVYARDNDMAFPPPLGEERHRKLIAPLLKTERFSRSFYARLKALRPECVELELGRDPAGAPERLLPPDRMTALFDRREALISHVDALAREHGVAQVLAFP